MQRSEERLRFVAAKVEETVQLVLATARETARACGTTPVTPEATRTSLAVAEVPIVAHPPAVAEMPPADQPMPTGFIAAAETTMTPVTVTETCLLKHDCFTLHSQRTQ